MISKDFPADGQVASSGVEDFRPGQRREGLTIVLECTTVSLAGTLELELCGAQVKEIGVPLLQ